MADERKEFDTLKDDIQIVSDPLGDLIRVYQTGRGTVDGKPTAADKAKIRRLCQAVEKMIGRICKLQREMMRDK